MSRFNGLCKFLLLSTLVGCGFSPGDAAAPTGAGGSTSSGAGGATGVGASSGAGASSGIGLTTGTSGGDVGIGGSSCGQTSVQVQPEPPDILIVQDKSLSMNQDASGMDCTTAGCSKWSQVSAAIDAVVTATDTSVNWGLVFFGTDNQCGVTSKPVVPVASMNGMKVQMAFSTNQPSSYTPTASAVDAAVTYMKTLTDTNPKYLLLATDGLPNCGAGGGMRGGNITADDSPAAETAVGNAKTAGFPTFVVGIATDSDQMANDTLNTMATNGGYPQSGAATQYYSVTDTASLEAALSKIVGMVASCTIPLTNVPANLSNVAVSAQDTSGKPVEILEDPTNGWSYTNGNMNVIQLNGTACDNLQSGSYSNFQFLYACDGTIICIDRNPDGSCGDHPM
jgi:von Willebrand factor type A domain